MATRKHTTIRAALASVALLGFVAGAAQAEPIIPSLYHLTWGGTVVPDGHGGAAPTVDAIREYLESQGITVDPELEIVRTQPGGAGLWVGEAWDRLWVDVAIVSNNGSVVCCSADFPYFVAGVNDNGLFIGFDELAGAFVSDGGDERVLRSEHPSLDAASIADLADRYGSEFWQQFWYFGTTFTAIDNANRIGGDSRFGNFVLDPVLGAPSAVPEPSSWLLLTGFLGWGLWLSWRDRTRS